jgi:hypothetical protein
MPDNGVNGKAKNMANDKCQNSKYQMVNALPTPPSTAGNYSSLAGKLLSLFAGCLVCWGLLASLPADWPNRYYYWPLR